MARLDRILKNDLCIGCGLCSAVAGSEVMRLDEKGFYKPDLSRMSSTDQEAVATICPGINVSDVFKHDSVWGRMIDVVKAWSRDPVIRFKASSGGVVSSLAIYLLESGKVDGILHVGADDSDFPHNRLYVSHTREEVIRRSSSRYAPAPVFDEIAFLLNNKEHYAFIGKPCDIAGMKNFLSLHPEYEGRIAYYIAIFCAGIPPYSASMKAIDTFDVDDKPVSLRYRGDGWPGYFKVTYAGGTTRQMTYDESWGKILGRELGFRCKICPDGIGLLADIATGDAWNTENGYPVFEEKEGENFVFVRNEKGSVLMSNAAEAGYIQMLPVPKDEIRQIQPYQFTRRMLSAWRVSAVNLYTCGLLKFRGVTPRREGLVKGLKEMAGTVKRLRRVRR